MSYLGVEFGSTRIKAVKINDEFLPVSSGDYTWVSEYRDGIWTYDINEAWTGLREALKSISEPGEVKSVGLSGMMHGYLAFDDEWNLLVPFRTWQNTITSEAAMELTELFGFNVPQRWSVAHLYQAILNNEEHIGKVAHITTLSGYIHYMLTGVNAVGICEASGMFPIDSNIFDYDKDMLNKMQELLDKKNIEWKIKDVLPGVLVAGDNAGYLTDSGAMLIDNILPPGIPFAPCEGDGGTGMVATNAVGTGTGNISAGTSIFAMVVLDKLMDNVYEEIDMVTTPAGKPVAMVHCNNCTNDSNAWISVLREAAEMFGAEPSTAELYTGLYEKSLDGDADCGGVLVCNYMAGEGITHMDEGRPMVIRKPGCIFNLANFFRASLYSTMVTLRLGMKILEDENVEIHTITGHGGLFKTPLVGQKYMSAACKTPITVMKTAGEGGAYGIALLAAYLIDKDNDETLDSYLKYKVFNNSEGSTVMADQQDILGFEKYTEEYMKLLRVEQSAIDNL